MSLSPDDLRFDSQHIWHPYTNLNQPTPVFGIERAEGVLLYTNDGKKLVDGMASWWSAVHGYNHPQLNAAIVNQLGAMSHVMFGGLTHQPAIDLARKLVNLTDERLDCVFFADSGSVAVEVALKMALQYWVSCHKPQKNKFLTIRGGYHGDTFGAMAVCDPENGMHSLFSGVLAEHYFVPAPQSLTDDTWDSQDIEAFRHCIEQNHETIAAVILEPLVQAAGGMHFYCPEYLRQVAKLCEAHQVLLILDEIATGFGRTGSLFAYQQAQIVPDILCLGKALTGGYMTLAATLCNRQVAETISGYQSGNLMHGPTFMANPLACAVANKSMELLLENDWQTQVDRIESQLLKELANCRNYSAVADVRVKGAIGVVELHQAVDMHQVQPLLVEQGVWIRPFGKLVYLMPPFVIQARELSQLTSAIETLVARLSR